MLLERRDPQTGHSDNAARESGLSRRTFLAAGAAAGGGLLLSFSLPSLFSPVRADPAGSFAPDAFILIDRDGLVTLSIP